MQCEKRHTQHEEHALSSSFGSMPLQENFANLVSGIEFGNINWNILNKYCEPCTLSEIIIL